MILIHYVYTIKSSLEVKVENGVYTYAIENVTLCKGDKYLFLNLYVIFSSPLKKNDKLQSILRLKTNRNDYNQ